MTCPCLCTVSVWSGSSPVSCLEWDAGSHLLWGMTCLSVYRQCLEREFSGLLPGVGRWQSSAVGYDLSLSVYRQCLEREFSGLLPGVGRWQLSAVGYDLSVCVPSVFGA